MTNLAEFREYIEKRLNEQELILSQIPEKTANHDEVSRAVFELRNALNAFDAAASGRDITEVAW